MNSIITYVKRIDPNFKTNRHWYAGITGRPEERPREHENTKGILCYHYKSWYVGSKENAKRIEEWLEQQGFTIHAKDLCPIDPKETAGILEDKHDEEYYVYVFQAVKDN